MRQKFCTSHKQKNNVTRQLQRHMRIHPVFHVSLLEPYHDNLFPGRIQPAPPPIVVDDEFEYVVNEVLDSKIERGTRLLYLIDWEGYLPEEHTWEPVSNLSNAKEAVAKYHSRHVNCHSPRELLRPTYRSSPYQARNLASLIGA